MTGLTCDTRLNAKMISLCCKRMEVVLPESVQAVSQFIPEVIASKAYIKGVEAKTVSLDDIEATLSDPEAMLWLGLKDPDLGMLQKVGKQLGLTLEVIEDLDARHRLPKVMDYDEVVLIVAMTVEIRATDGMPSFGETQILIGSNFLLTIRRGAVSSHTELRKRLEKLPGRIARGPDYIATELLDLMIDRYNVAYDQFEKTVENIEQSLLIRGIEGLKVRKLYQIRREFQRMHTMVAPLEEVCRRLAHLEMMPISALERMHFAALSDRVGRVDRLLDNLGNGLAFAFEAGMLIEQSKQTDTTRRLAAWAAILAVPTAIAGIYGMNFDYIPILKWKYGFLMSVVLMGVVCSVMYYKFRQAKWL